MLNLKYSVFVKCVWVIMSLVFFAMSQNVFADAKGIGPISELKLESLNVEMATKGKKSFTTKCSACHKMDERYVGPGLKDVTKRRTPEWIMNMMLNPAEMLQKDAVAQELLGEFMVPMTFQNITNDDARSILEYFRHYDEKGDIVDAAKPAAKKSSKVKK